MKVVVDLNMIELCWEQRLQ